MTQTKSIFYARVPQGEVKKGDGTFETKTVDVDESKLNGGLLVKLLALSVDPYLRGRMRPTDVKSYAPPLQPGEPMTSIGISKVLKSESDKFKEGDLVSYWQTPWQDIAVIGKDVVPQLQKLPSDTQVPVEKYLSVLGMPGRTAFCSFHDILADERSESQESPYTLTKKPKTLFVTAASGAVGQLVVQMGVKAGMRVIGSAGSKEKVEFVKSLGAEHAFNYKEADASEELKKFSPEGIDALFENVGGAQFDAWLENAAFFGRAAVCGWIVGYHGDRPPVKNLMNLVGKRLHIQGDYGSEWTKRFQKEMGEMLQAGEIKSTEDVIEGLDNAEEQWLKMMKGGCNGKAVVKVSSA